MSDKPVQKAHPPRGDPYAELPLHTLWYRFLFFDWMFRDLRVTLDPFERHAAQQHNRYMRRYLPIYLRRWMALGMTGYALGCLCERYMASNALAAWCFTWACMAITGTMIIGVAWACLARPR